MSWCVVLRRTGGDSADDGGARRLVARRRDATRGSVRASRWTPRTCCISCTRRGTTAKPKGIVAHDRRLSRRRRRRRTTTSSTSSPTRVYWCAADVGWVTGPLVHRLRAAVQRDDRGAVRGDAGLPRQGPLVGDRRAVRRRRPLHGADGDPRAHEVGAGVRGAARSVDAAAARVGRRADQPGGVDVVPRAHRRRTDARSSTRGGRPRRG